MYILYTILYSNSVVYYSNNNFLYQTRRPRPRRRSLCDPENDFAICFLLEIPLWGFPFQIKTSGNTECLNKNNTSLIVQRISFEKEIPSGGSQAGDISQTS